MQKSSGLCVATSYTGGEIICKTNGLLRWSDTAETAECTYTDARMQKDL